MTAPQSTPLMRWSFAGLCVVLTVLIVTTFQDYGISWDEFWHATYGSYVVHWYTSLFQDQQALSYWTLIYYGALFDVVATVLSTVSPFGLYETRHLLSAVCGLVAIVAVYKLGEYLSGPAVGLLSALFLLLTPAFYGQAFVNPKDIPLATFFLLSMYLIIRSVRDFPRWSARVVLALGITIGLALGVRVGALMLFFFLALAFCLWYARQRALHAAGGPEQPALRSAVLSFGKGYVAIGAIAYAFMLVWWPWAQVNPIVRPLQALRHLATFPWQGTVFFEGQTFPGTDVPWYYLLKFFALTLPEFYFVALAIAVGLFTAWALRWRSGSWRHPRAVEYALVAGWAALPVALASASGATVYDGTRHFLFVLPALAVLGAAAVVELVNRSRVGLARVAVAGVVVGSLALTAVDMVHLHPYEYVYFNRSVAGGLKQAATLYETEYWGSSYREGAKWIAQHYDTQGDGRKLTVASCGFPESTSYYLPPQRFEYLGSQSYPWLMSGATSQPDVFLAATRWNCHETLDGQIVHVVTRQDTPLLYIKELTGGLVAHVDGTSDLVGEWIDPSTGDVIELAPLVPGERTVRVPPFVVDLALLFAER